MKKKDDFESKFKTIDTIIKKFVEDMLGGQSMSEYLNIRDELNYALKKYKTLKEYESDIYRRTDLSDDEKWSIEEQWPYFELGYLMLKELK